MAVAPAPLPVSFWSLGWRSLWRDWRAGELRLLVLAVTLAVAALTAVGFFADRLQGGLARDARALIGGDAVISADNQPSIAFEERARELGLRTTQTLGFPTMGRADEAQGGGARLVALKVVAPGYPLRGRLRVATQPEGAGELTRDIPAPGQAWVEAPLLEAIGLLLAPVELERFRLGPTHAQDIAQLLATDDQPALAAVRSRHLGFILQSGGLLPFLRRPLDVMTCLRVCLGL